MSPALRSTFSVPSCFQDGEGLSLASRPCDKWPGMEAGTTLWPQTPTVCPILLDLEAPRDQLSPSFIICFCKMQGDSPLFGHFWKVQGGFSSGSVLKEDPLEKEGATYSIQYSCLEIPWTEDLHGVTKESGRDSATKQQQKAQNSLSSYSCKIQLQLS